MKQRHTFIVLACLLLVILVVPALIGLPERYHRWRFSEAERAVYIDKKTTRSLLLFRNDRDSRNYHLRRLVDLGVLIKMEHEFHFLRNGTPEGRGVVQKLINRTCPPFTQFSSPVAEPGEPLQLITWFEPRHEAQWKAFIERMDRKESESHSLKPGPEQWDAHGGRESGQSTLPESFSRPR